jgi:hypothetical protein
MVLVHRLLFRRCPYSRGYCTGTEIPQRALYPTDDRGFGRDAMFTRAAG